MASTTLSMAEDIADSIIDTIRSKPVNPNIDTIKNAISGEIINLTILTKVASLKCSLIPFNLKKNLKIS
jgi:hypothetical protein